MVFEDWLWHFVLPFIAYAAPLVAAAAITRNSTRALFGVGAVALLLLFIGIHNAWDSVTYVAVDRLHRPPDEPEQGPSGGA